MKQWKQLLALLVLQACALPALAKPPIGWVGEPQPGRTDSSTLLIAGGWTLDPGHPCKSTRAYVEIFEITAGGDVGSLLTGAWVDSEVYRPDVNSIYCPGSPVRVGFEFTAAVAPRPGYYVRARGEGLDKGDVNAWLLGDHRFARRTLGNSVLGYHDVFLRHRGAMTGLSRPNDYESYPSAMRDDDGVLKMWFAGGPADKIYYATNRTGDPVNGPGWTTDWKVVLGESPVVKGLPAQLDSGLVADPSVVRADGLYFMMYTGIPQAMDCNRIFSAVSLDGVHWVKMNGRLRLVDGNAYPVIPPERCIGYGAGQSSMIFGSGLPVGNYQVGHGFVQFHTDTSAAGGGALVRTSENGGWDWPLRGNLMAQNPPLGDVTWDFKYLSWARQYLGAVAIPGDIGRDGFRHGEIGLTMGDGMNFASQVRVPMNILNPNPKEQCINNGGLLGNSAGFIVDNRTVLYFGAGYLMNSDTYSRWPPLDWDLHAVDIRIY